MTIDVSVIISTYRREKYLYAAIQSVLQQKDCAFEILVCEDGETDTTRDVVSQFNDKRIIYLPGKHTGIPAIVRNRGISQAKGEWIAFLDDDDRWRNNKLYEQLRIARCENVKAICSNAMRVDDNGYQLGLYFDTNTIGKTINFDLLVHNNYIICSSVCIHKSVFQKIGGFPEEQELKSGEDFALWLRIANFNSFRFIDNDLVIYRDSPQNSIRLFSKNINEYVLLNFIRWGGKKFCVRNITIAACIKFYILIKKYTKKIFSLQLKVK